MLFVDITEDKNRTCISVLEVLLNCISEPNKHVVAKCGLQYEQGKDELQSKTPSNCSPFYLQNDIGFYVCIDLYICSWLVYARNKNLRFQLTC